MIRADLHMHSTASDGTDAPAALMAQAAEAGLTHVALTDHDSVDGWAEAKKEADARGLVLLPGVELSCGAEKEIHILGYGFDPENAALRAFCRERREERRARGMEMVERLNQAGIPIRFEQVWETAHGLVARPHVARVLRDMGVVRTTQEAFDRYLTPGRPGYVPKREVSVADAAALLTAAGGIPVLAHPMQLKFGNAYLSSLIHEWTGQGLRGLEVYHPSTMNQDVGVLLRIALGEGLLVTGGSDYHGKPVRDISLGQGTERWSSMEGDVRRLLGGISCPEA